MLEPSNIPAGYCQCGCGQKTNLAPYSSKRKGWKKGEPLKYYGRHRTPGSRAPKPPKPKIRRSHHAKHKTSYVFESNFLDKFVDSEAALGQEVSGREYIVKSGEGRLLVALVDDVHQSVIRLRKKKLKVQDGRAKWRLADIREEEEILSWAKETDVRYGSLAHICQVFDLNAKKLREDIHAQLNVIIPQAQGNGQDMQAAIQETKCHYCSQPLTVRELMGCECDKDKGSHHDGAAWCSLDCLTNDHNQQEESESWV